MNAEMMTVDLLTLIKLTGIIMTGYQVKIKILLKLFEKLKASNLK